MPKEIGSSQGFLPKKTSMLTFSGSRHARFSFTTYPAILKALSEGTDVAGMQRYFLAILAKRGKGF